MIGIEKMNNIYFKIDPTNHLINEEQLKIFKNDEIMKIRYYFNLDGLKIRNHDLPNSICINDKFVKRDKTIEDLDNERFMKLYNKIRSCEYSASVDSLDENNEEVDNGEEFDYEDNENNDYDDYEDDDYEDNEDDGYEEENEQENEQDNEDEEEYDEENDEDYDEEDDDEDDEEDEEEYDEEDDEEDDY